MGSVGTGWEDGEQEGWKRLRREHGREGRRIRDFVSAASSRAASHLPKPDDDDARARAVPNSITANPHPNPCRAENLGVAGCPTCRWEKRVGSRRPRLGDQIQKASQSTPAPTLGARPRLSARRVLTLRRFLPFSSFHTPTRRCPVCSLRKTNLKQ